MLEPQVGCKVDFNPEEPKREMGDASLSYRDASMGSRILVGLSVNMDALHKRVRLRGLEPITLSNPGSGSFSAFAGANLFCVFNDFLLNHEGTGEIPSDANPRYVGFNIPCVGAFPSKINMYHFRVYTGDTTSVPGKFGDYEPAEVERYFELKGSGNESHIREVFRVRPNRGGLVELKLEYERRRANRVGSPNPDMWVWADQRPGQYRAYKDDSVWETVLSYPLQIDQTKQCNFRVDVDELHDLFDGNEKLIAVATQPLYVRKVYVREHLGLDSC